MKRRLVIWLPLLGFVGLVAAFGHGLTRDPNQLTSALLDHPVPDFTLPPVMDGVSGLARGDLAGKPVLINFFASWCAPCREEHAELMRLSQAGVTIQGIAYKDRPADSETFVKRLGNPFARIGGDLDGRAAIDFGVTGVPETFVVDGQGRVRLRIAGAMTRQRFEREVRPALDSAR